MVDLVENKQTGYSLKTIGKVIENIFKISFCRISLAVMLATSMDLAAASAKLDCSQADLSSIGHFSSSESKDICVAASKGTTGGLPTDTLKSIAMGVNVLRVNGSNASITENAYWFAAIIKLRGHSDLPALAHADVDRVTRTFISTEGKYTPKEAAQLLYQIGDMARTLSENGFIDTMSLDIVTRRNAGEPDTKKWK
jgi:hypothetical protein